MFGFFKKKKHQQNVRVLEDGSDAESGIRFSSELVPRLKSDHQELLVIYQAIQKRFAEGDLGGTVSKLADFRYLLQDHLLTENVRFYLYLSQQFAEDETNSELIRGFRQEMDAIGRIVLRFLDRYEKMADDHGLANSFLQEFGEIGAVLTKRIKKEEQTLYPLYLPHY
ncbi:hemerythrin domain-containing protein [Acidihalobacter aeolianus]|uniref:hemerythrin domain-containing protein n=1 Tax=Acidihalobacter aeolianus TaxID=2792603 RepID=UPI0018D494DC|nr:hemerythrin domain-containing protein [Acidihalobacter aeolianus]